MRDDTRLRMGVIGLGKIAQTRFIPALLTSSVARFTAIGTRDPQRATRNSGFESEVQIMGYEELVARGRDAVDAVYIALPNHLHAEWTIRAAAAGLHVLCEKPLSWSRAEALRCRHAAEENHVLVAEAFMYRHNPRHARVRELVRSGRIGRPHLLEATFSYFLEDLANVRLRSDLYGGALLDVGCYGIDVARMILDEEPIDVTARCVRGATSDVDEVTTVVMTFGSGCMGVVTCSTHLQRRHDYCVRGTHGSIRVPMSFIPNPNDQSVLVIESAGEEFVEVFEPHEAFDHEIRHFAASVAAGRLLAPVEDGVATAGTLELALSALARSGVVVLDW